MESDPFGLIESMAIAGFAACKALATNFNARREEATLYRELATLRTDAPLEESLEDLRWSGPNDAALSALCEKLDDTGILERARSLASQ